MKNCVAPTLLSLLFVFTTFVQADEVTEKARKIWKEHRDAVIKVKLVSKVSISMNGQVVADEQESKSEITGTIINKNGLTLISLAEADPSHLLAARLAGREGFEIKSDMTSIKLIMPSGKEVSSKILLRDKDLDLAFIAPEKKLKAPVPYIDLADHTYADVLDQVIGISRLEKVAKRASLVQITRINALVEKPRTFYVAKDLKDFGTPVLNFYGKAIGILLVRSGRGSDSGIAMILNAQDVLDVAIQAENMMEAEMAKAAAAKEEAESTEDVENNEEDNEENSENKDSEDSEETEEK